MEATTSSAGGVDWGVATLAKDNWDVATWAEDDCVPDHRGRPEAVLSSLSIIQGVTFHLTTRLDTEFQKVAMAFAVRAIDFATSLTLSHKCSGGGLNPLFFPMSDKVFLMVD
jgi:hypothetical protein